MDVDSMKYVRDHVQVAIQHNKLEHAADHTCSWGKTCSTIGYNGSQVVHHLCLSVKAESLYRHTQMLHHTSDDVIGCTKNVHHYVAVSPTPNLNSSSNSNHDPNTNANVE